MREVPSQAGRRAERGQAIVEFALVLVVLFPMLVGIVHFAMAVNLQQVLNGAAHEGARTWAKSPGGGGYQCYLPCDAPELDYFRQNIEQRVKNYVTESGFTGPMTVTPKITPDAVTVTIYYSYSPLFGNYFGMTLSASCTFKKG